MRLRAALTAAVASLALVASAAPMAEAAPAAPPPPQTAQGWATGGSTGWKARGDDRKLSKTTQANLKIARTISEKAINKSRTTLDYGKANKYDKGKVTLRRQFAAGWLWSGKKISHISSAELKAVKREIPAQALAHKPLKTKAYGLALVGPAKAANSKCTGVTKSVQKAAKGKPWDWWYYYNSCKTNDIKFWLKVGAGAAGVVAALFPPSAPLTVTVAALLVVGQDWIDNKQANSPVDAVIIRDHFHLVSVRSQL